MEKKSEIKFVINTNETCKAAQMLPPCPLALKQQSHFCPGQLTGNVQKGYKMWRLWSQLRLDQEERLNLNECSCYFEDDAWLAVGANIQHSTEAQGLIVPVLAESEDEEFWIFYSIQNPSKLVKASSAYKLKGYWLDQQGQSNYKLLNNQQDVVTIANLIKNGPYGPLYFLQRMEISDDQYFNIPQVFNKAILAALRSSNKLLFKM